MGFVIYDFLSSWLSSSVQCKNENAWKFDIRRVDNFCIIHLLQCDSTTCKPIWRLNNIIGYYEFQRIYQALDFLDWNFWYEKKRNWNLVLLQDNFQFDILGYFFFHIILYFMHENFKNLVSGAMVNNMECKFSNPANQGFFARVKIFNA